MQVRLKEIDADNWREALGLELNPDQEHFVASNVYSLAEAYVKPEWPVYRPLAVYDGEQLVGFAMYTCNPASAKNHYVQRLMIDRRFQGRGYGRAAMAELLKLIRGNESCEEISLCVDPQNVNARSLYRSLGFEGTGEMLDGQEIFTLRLKRPNEEEV
jgi:diamine N-acetyltransferase